MSQGCVLHLILALPKTVFEQTHMKTPAHGKRRRRHAEIEAIEKRVLMSAAAFTLTDLAPFTSSVGHQSEAGLIRDASGNLYGTTTLGGAHNLGTIFKVANGSSAVTTVASFTANSGTYPTADLVMDSAGNLYGTTPVGGVNGLGTVFKLAAGSSTITTLAPFTSAANDLASVKLVIDPSGNLYGITPFGGANSAGSIFEIVAGSGTITTLASFSTVTGDVPSSGLLRDSAGNLYGTTPRDGPDGFGTIYELPFNTSSITVLAPFTSTNSVEQASALTLDSHGNLFGTTQFGGSSSDGSIYELPAGSSSIATLASFNGSNGANPSSASIIDTSGNLFGTTASGGIDNDGTIWEMVAGSNTISTVATFTGTNGSPGTDGYSHNATMPSLIGDGQGDYFGVAPAGAPGGLGAVYSLMLQRATKVVVAQQPMGNIAAGATQFITLDMDTVSNTIDSTNHATVSLAILSGPTGGAISGTASAAAVAGVANFSGISFNLAGVYTLTATSTGLTSAIFIPFTVTAGAASALLITQQPTGATAGQSLGNTIVEVTDAHGNVVTSDASTVSVAASGGAALNGSTNTQAVAGVATFTGLTIDKAGTFTLLLSDGALPSLNTSSFTVTPGTASQLMIAQQPAASVIAGQPIGTVTVDLDDSFGNVVSKDTAKVTVSVGGTAITGTASKSAVAGVATFTGLAIDTAGTYTLAVSTSGLSAINSSSFVVNPAAASRLFVMQQPQATASFGANIGPVIIGFKDAFGNVVTANTSTVAVATTTGSPVVGAASAAAVAAVATFSSLTIHAAGTFTLTVTDGKLPAIQTASFVITPAVPTQLVITQQPPVSTVAGQSIAAVEVDVEDATGDVVTIDSSMLTVTITGASLSGTTTRAAQGGVATFGDLSITAAGSYTLTVTDGSLTSAISSSFNIIAGAASQLVFENVPTTATVKEPIGSVQAELQDSFGNVAISDKSEVKIAVNKKGVLSGTIEQAARNGVATFADLTFTRKGTFPLIATDGSLTPATSSPIIVSPKQKPSPGPRPRPHPTPTPLPLQAIVAVAGTRLPKIVIDSNTDFGVTSDHTLMLTVTFAGVPANGVAIPARGFRVIGGYSTISNLRIRSAGIYTMVISNALGNTVSDQVTILPAHAASLRFSSQPTFVNGSSRV
jgi:uncharacterized repeat protein (TIGR03803 family)